MKIKQRYIRYVILLFAFIIFTYAIKVFFQNFNMNKEITNLRLEQSNLSGDTVWMKKYYKPYVNSKYMKKAFLHKSWIPASDEILVKITQWTENITWDMINSIEKYKNYDYNDNVQGNWNKFFLALYKQVF